MSESPTLIRTVLVADDEPLTLRAIQSTLTDRGFVVRLASDGSKGLSLVDTSADDHPELLITDMDMPGCCGDQLAVHARERYQGIKIIFTSGLPHPALVKGIASDPNSRFLEKPFLRADLLKAMSDLGIAF